MLTDIYQVEHFHQTLIPWVGFSPSAHLLLPESDITGILQYDFIVFFDYENTIFPIKVRIDDAIRQRFPQRPVNRRIIDPKTALHPKWHFNISCNLIVYTKIKIKYISRPFAG